MLLTKLTYGSVTNVTSTGELGGLFLPLAIGYRPDAYTSAGFSRATYATYDEASNYSNPYINKVMVTPPTLGTPCRAATTANISLSGIQTIDGIGLIAGDRVLVKDQTTATQNGIYTVASSSWTRPFDSDTGTELQVRSFFKITLGTVNADYYAVIQNTGTITLGTTAINYDLILDPVLLESQTVYWLRFKDFPATPQYYSTDNYTNPINPKLATTANITLSGNQTIDGVLTVNGDYVLVKNQTTPLQNGFYVASSGAWYGVSAYFTYYLPWIVYVSHGTVNGGRTIHFVSNSTSSITSMILYPTLADATAETNALIPAYKTAFDVEWITKPYTPIGCVEMAAANVADIYCCPEPTPLLQTFPDHVEIIFGTYGSLAARTVVARLFDPTNTYVSTYNGATYSGVNGINFFHYEYDATISCSGVPRTNLRSSFWFRIASYGGGLQAQIMRYELDTYASVCASSYAYYSDYYYYVWRSNEPYYYDVGPTPPFTFYQTLPHSWASYDRTVAPSTFSSSFIDPTQPELTSFDIQYAQTIPPAISCYLVDAVFKRTTVDIPSGDDIAIGTISVALTYDAASSTYYGPVANYYNIPGRLSMPIGILPTVASGSQFLVNGINWKVNSSNQIYYEKYLSSGAMDNTITLFYSGYSDARKPTPATLNFYQTNSYSVYTETNGSLMRSDPTTQTATP